MNCKILILQKGEQVTAGTVTYAGGKVSAKANKGFEELMKEVLEEEHGTPDKVISPRGDALVWFKDLPRYYSGVYMRAEMEK